MCARTVSYLDKLSSCGRILGIQRERRVYYVNREQDETLFGFSISSLPQLTPPIVLSNASYRPTKNYAELAMTLTKEVLVNRGDEVAWAMYKRHERQASW